MKLTSMIMLVGSVLGAVSVAHSQQPSQPIVSDIGDIRPADATKFYKKPGYSPYAGRHYPERPYFGDEHTSGGNRCSKQSR